MVSSFLFTATLVHMVTAFRLQELGRGVLQARKEFHCLIGFRVRVKPPAACWAASTEILPDLSAWSDSMGIRKGKIYPFDFNGLRGMRSSEEIKSGGLLVELPISATLCVGSDQPCPVPEWVDERFWYTCSLHVRLALLLLYEVAKGKESDYYPWILSLPASHEDKLARWSQEELDELQDDNLAEDARRQRDTIDGVFEALRASSSKTAVTPCCSALACS